MNAIVFISLVITLRAKGQALSQEDQFCLFELSKQTHLSQTLNMGLNGPNLRAIFCHVHLSVQIVIEG